MLTASFVFDSFVRMQPMNACRSWASLHRSHLQDFNFSTGGFDFCLCALAYPVNAHR
jgi:hypothetical protein